MQTETSKLKLLLTALAPDFSHVMITSDLLSYLKPQALHSLNKFLHCFPTAVTYTMTNTLGKSDNAPPFPRHKEKFVTAIAKFYPEFYPAQDKSG